MSVDSVSLSTLLSVKAGIISSLIVALVLCLTYGAAVGVALFHPDKERRTDARKLLSAHKLTRKPPRKNRHR